MRTAFKEWAVIVDALGRGDQIVILRKGGIHEVKGGFQVDQPRFLLFPTLFHQQRESVLPSAQTRFDALPPTLSGSAILRVEYFAEVAAWQWLDSLATAERLRGQHVWRDEVIAQRFDWGREANLAALAVRVFRLARPVDLPMLPAYGGCKSWVELAVEVATDGVTPVLSDGEFARKLAAFRAAVSGMSTDANSHPA